jgi:hypothetical protein
MHGSTAEKGDLANGLAIFSHGDRAADAVHPRWHRRRRRLSQKQGIRDNHAPTNNALLLAHMMQRMLT